MIKDFNYIVIKQIKSTIGKNQNKKNILKSLGLKKINNISILKKSNSVLEMIYKIQNLIKVLMIK